MLKTGAPVIPIFYNVKPSDLRCLVIHTSVLHTIRWTTIKSGIQYCEDLRRLEEEKILDPQVCQKRQRICGFEWSAYGGCAMFLMLLLLSQLNLLAGAGSTNVETSAATVGYLPHRCFLQKIQPIHFAGTSCYAADLVLTCDEERLVRDVVKCVWTMVRGHKSASYSYDVFLNHRGSDTKNTLASNLYYRLRDRGLRVFLDKEEIQKGSRIDSVIKNVIKDTLAHVAIFSAGYAESEYCMDELLFMKESGSTIIPVYYNLNYTDMWSNTVNKRNGVYDESLRILKEEKIFDRETHEDKERYQSSSIEQWKKALMEVTGREGFKLQTYIGDEVTRLVDMIVEEVDKSKVVGKTLAAANGNAI